MRIQIQIFEDKGPLMLIHISKRDPGDFDSVHYVV